MGGLARVASELGHEVGGCDTAVYPPMSTQLETVGIQMDSGYQPSCFERGWDCFVIGNAVPRGNPLVEEILRRRLPFVSGPEWLAREVLGSRRVLAVAGTHGKTTTTAMLAWILDRSHLAPGFVVGGVPVNFGVSARAGGAVRHGQAPGCFVVEADEYDTAFFDKRPKFIHYHPNVLVLNNLEFDHADIYADLDAIKRQFHFLLRTVPANSIVLYRSGDAALRSVLDMGVWTPCESFGLSCGESGERDSDWFAEVLTDGFRLFYRGCERGTCRWSLPGTHNVANALAAIAAAHHAGVEIEVSLRTLEHDGFLGVRRRLEVKAEVSGVVIYDDFAHHPTAIRTALEAVAGIAAGGRVIAVFEPCSSTMKMGVHNEVLSSAFADADKLFCYRPPALAQVVDAAFAGVRPPAVLSGSSDELLAQLCAEVQTGDRVVFMSSGGFDNLPECFVIALQGTQP